ncbi:MurR/RpiR family transcriptional regulator [Chenggangzhangella methanolivorans]|uniref:MurR/RpiR family transcriptional regulator n=1 Tax=Chenggangzhangella methanolivorans TaxID=1437009 RepID=A0A9E6RBY4_9HYPH|nr:MurR/RpiR family transcriptional regulator [Chenggangzhangella methanolivorans]QZO01050.1 MurR/RpiR family transcriptional regulator [Chenggangzhangella methanolivorans]
MGPNPEGATPATVAQALGAIASQLTPQERRAADHLATHYPIAGLAPMARFARSAGASSQTVLRLLAKLGMDNWRSLQDRLRSELAAERASPLGRWTAHRAELAPKGGDSLQAFGDHLALNVQAAFRDLDRAQFETAAQRLADPRRRVLVVGGRLSQSLARLSVRHLEIIRGGVEEVGSLSSTWPDRLIDVGRRTAVLAYDVRRYQPDVVRLCRFCAERGAAVVLMTDAPEAPAAAFAEATLVGPTASAGAWDSFTGLVALTEALLARVTELSSQEASERLARLEQIRERVLDGR